MKFGNEIEQLLKEYSFKERYEWIKQKKDEGNEKFLKSLHEDAVDEWIKALCGFNFNQTNIQPLELE